MRARSSPSVSHRAVRAWHDALAKSDVLRGVVQAVVGGEEVVTMLGRCQATRRRRGRALDAPCARTRWRRGGKVARLQQMVVTAALAQVLA